MTLPGPFFQAWEAKDPQVCMSLRKARKCKGRASKSVRRGRKEDVLLASRFYEQQNLYLTKASSNMHLVADGYCQEAMNKKSLNHESSLVTSAVARGHIPPRLLGWFSLGKLGPSCPAVSIHIYHLMCTLGRQSAEEQQASFYNGSHWAN